MEHSSSLRGLSQILVGPSGEEIPKEKEAAEPRADLITLGKGSGSQDITKGSAINANRSLIEPILSVRHCDSVCSMAFPPS